MAEARRAQAERDAQALLDSARKTLAAEREQALAEARRAALDLGADSPHGCWRKCPCSFAPKPGSSASSSTLTRLPKPERDALVRQLGDGEPLTVVTAARSPHRRREKWRERLRHLLGMQIAIEFKVRSTADRRRGTAFPERRSCASLGRARSRAARAEIGARCQRSLTNSTTGSQGSRQRLGAVALEPQLEQIGRVVQVGDGVATVRGLPETRLDELLVFEGGVRGLAVDLGEEAIGCVLLGETSGIAAGSIVHGTGEVARVPVGDWLLGRVVDALGAR